MEFPQRICKLGTADDSETCACDAHLALEARKLFSLGKLAPVKSRGKLAKDGQMSSEGARNFSST